MAVIGVWNGASMISCGKLVFRPGGTGSCGPYTMSWKQSGSPASFVLAVNQYDFRARPLVVRYNFTVGDKPQLGLLDIGNGAACDYIKFSSAPQ